jgi:hypothetical protein
LPCHYTDWAIQSTLHDLCLWLTPCRGALLEKLTVTQLAKKFLAYYGTRRFIPLFTEARHYSVSWARWIQSTSYFFKMYLTLSSHLCLGLSSGLFYPCFPTKMLYFSYLPCVLHDMPSHTLWLYHPNSIWWI